MASGKEYILPVVIAAAIPLGHAWRSVRLPDPLPVDLPAVRLDSSAQSLAPLTAMRKESRRVSKPSLNTATLADLVAADGIGPKFAEKLLLARPPGGFRNWADVDAIPGVGPKRLRELQAQFALP